MHRVAGEARARTTTGPSCVRGVAGPKLPNTVVLYMDKDVVSMPGLPLSGERGVEVRFSLDIVDLRHMKPSAPLSRAFLSVVGTRRQFPLVELMLLLQSAGRKVQPILRQILWVVATAAENSVWPRGNDGPVQDGGEDAPQREGDALLEVGATAKQTVVMNKCGLMSGNRRCLRYFLRSRRVFSSASAMSIAVDASRLGRSGVLLGVLCTPENEAAWMPPQASLSGSHPSEITFGPCGFSGCPIGNDRLSSHSEVPAPFPVLWDGSSRGWEMSFSQPVFAQIAKVVPLRVVYVCGCLASGYVFERIVSATGPP